MNAQTCGALIAKHFQLVMLQTPGSGAGVTGNSRANEPPDRRAGWWDIAQNDSREALFSNADLAARPGQSLQPSDGWAGVPDRGNAGHSDRSFFEIDVGRDQVPS